MAKIEPVKQRIEYTITSSDKSEEQNLVDGLRAIMSEFDAICERLEKLCVDVSLSYDGNTGHAIVNAKKITTTEL